MILALLEVKRLVGGTKKFEGIFEEIRVEWRLDLLPKTRFFSGPLPRCSFLRINFSKYIVIRSGTGGKNGGVDKRKRTRHGTQAPGTSHKPTYY